MYIPPLVGNINIHSINVLRKKVGCDPDGRVVMTNYAYVCKYGIFVKFFLFFVNFFFPKIHIRSGLVFRFIIYINFKQSERRESDGMDAFKQGKVSDCDSTG